jgi:gas vesicle protein
MFGFIVGFISGGTIGAFTMALLIASRFDEYDCYYEGDE